MTIILVFLLEGHMISLGAIHLLRSQRGGGGGYPKANVVSEVA